MLSLLVSVGTTFILILFRLSFKLIFFPHFRPTRRGEGTFFVRLAILLTGSPIILLRSFCCGSHWHHYRFLCFVRRKLMSPNKKQQTTFFICCFLGSWMRPVLWSYANNATRIFPFCFPSIYYRFKDERRRFILFSTSSHIIQATGMIL